MTTIYESEIEQLALDLLHDENGYDVLYGPDIADGPDGERALNQSKGPVAAFRSQAKGLEEPLGKRPHARAMGRRALKMMNPNTI